MLLLRTWRPLQFDFHGLGSEIERHLDPMSVGRHDRFAIVGQESAGGKLRWSTHRRITRFRVDVCESSVAK
jgi:hypothetical protein